MDLYPFWSFFEGTVDPRCTSRGNFRHELKDIILISLCGMLCGLRSFEEIEEFALDQVDWFRQFLDLPNGIPSHDTMERVLSMLDAEDFERRFTHWAQGVVQLFPGETIAIDGKTVRRSGSASEGKKPVHIVTAWAGKNQVSIGQLVTDDKTNEVTTIPKLLEALALSGCIVTIDAMGCQREIAKQITEEKAADYVLGLKGNQGTMHTEVKAFFESAFEENDSQKLRHALTVDKGHGRIEERECWVSEDIDGLPKRDEWANLQSIVCVKSRRHVGDKTTSETRYFISSLAGAPAERMLEIIRSHWGIENKLHYTLDVSMGEDACRRRKLNFAHISAAMRKIVLNLFAIPGRNKTSIPRKMAKSLYSRKFRAQVLFSGKTLKN